MGHLIYAIFAVLCLVGGVFSFRHSTNYSNASAKTNTNQFRGFALSAGYIIGGLLVVLGVIFLIAAIFVK